MKVTSIRFNLKFFNAGGGEVVVRTLDDLRSKFNLSDLYDYFKAGDLARWLSSINRSELSDAVEKANGNGNLRNQIYGLCDVLALPVDKIELEKFVSFLERQDQLREKKNVSDSKSGKNYFDKSYVELVNDVFAAKDFKSIKERLAVFAGNAEYEVRFLRDVLNVADCVDRMVLLAILGHEQWRRYLHHLSGIRIIYWASGGEIIADTDDDCLCVAGMKDRKSFTVYQSCLKLSEFDRKLLERCVGEPSPRGKFRAGGIPYTHDEIGSYGYDGIYKIYDDKGDPVGKLGAVINEYISW